MRVSAVCRPCLERLVYQAAEIATTDPELRAEATKAGLAVLHNAFSYDKVATQIATECHRAIKRVTDNQDLYREIKVKELEMAERLFREVRSNYGEDLRSCVKLATLGNTIDFFKERTRVTYVVKGFPVQNDITLTELSEAGLTEEVGEVITTGSDAVGIDFSSASEEFKDQFELADLVFAKGMGNYETLSELPVYGKIVYCLMAKCQPIADSLEVPLNSYVIMLR